MSPLVTQTQTFEQGCNIGLGGGNFGQSLAGQPLPIAPEWSGNLGFDYHTDLSDNMILGFMGNARYTDDYLANEQGDQRPAATNDSFWIVDVGVRLIFKQKIRLALICRNLADEMWYTRVSDKPGASGQLQSTPNQGRQYIVEVQYDF